MSPNKVSNNKNGLGSARTPTHVHGASNIRPAGNLHGIWRKDYQSSDMEGLSRAMEAMQLSRVQKMAAMNIINGLAVQLNETQDSATVQYLTKIPIPFYKVHEQFRKGEETHMKRRDLRAGYQRAFAHTLNKNEMKVELAWEGDLPARVEEKYQVNNKGQLVVRGVMEVNGKKYHVLQVYNKES